MRIVIAVFIVLAAVGGYLLTTQREPEPPTAFYERYLAAVKAGRSFDEDAAYHSSAKRAEVEADIAARDNAEEMKKLYLDMTQQAANCATLTLSEQTETLAGVRLIYDVEDTCGTFGDAKVTEIIDLVDEGGWKIASNETRIEN